MITISANGSGANTAEYDRVDAATVARFAATLDTALADNAFRMQPIGACAHPIRQPAIWDRTAIRQLAAFCRIWVLPRRMWAASEVEFVSPLKIGAAVERISRIVSVDRKDGKSGPLGFVTIAHETHCDAKLAVAEKQTLVYRGKQAAQTQLPPVRDVARQLGSWPWYRELVPGPVLLQRFSAVTFNSHRIHYDLPYARQVEGYPGLVVHGPLIAALLVDLGRRELGGDRMARFRVSGNVARICRAALASGGAQG